MNNLCKKRDRMFEKYAQDVEVTHGGYSYKTKGIIQLMRYWNKIYLDMPQCGIGRRDNGTYLYIGHPDCPIDGDIFGSTITYKGKRYGIKRAHTVYCFGEPLYVWAVLYIHIKGGKYADA